MEVPPARTARAGQETVEDLVVCAIGRDSATSVCMHEPLRVQRYVMLFRAIVKVNGNNGIVPDLPGCGIGALVFADVAVGGDVRGAVAMKKLVNAFCRFSFLQTICTCRSEWRSPFCWGSWR